ncbi:hypothetical protein HYPSUDRAFT_419894 [Hypholoma sublateritium FD-334 SS-4]|uniref:Fungal-type protein kinase domain-containing protein n=1 Tax=Hypholoma sublateritium (strain FD-334 SS-4) TaxID=945553 RepID=A0A0D2Q146_HYPSF|nr:hypothetical protein HYPSUDRAFT_419894 [Hypholoma sublateritium FD-334 SS-4]
MLSTYLLLVCICFFFQRKLFHFNLRTGGTLRLWVYDRQETIQSDGISITADFPRFLVLLLTIHRCSVQDYAIPWANAEAHDIDTSQYNGRDVKKVLCPPVEYVPKFPRRNFDNIILEGPLFVGEEGYLPHGIASRAASLFNAVHDEKTHAVKTPSTEAQRAFLDEREPSLTKGRRTLRLVVSEGLVPLTSQTGKSFVDAWLDAVTCHAFLWKHGVEHSDPSLWNVMYHPVRECGVLTDFDLSVISWLPRVPGSDRTGTIPFMALDHLHDAYWEGNITRHYHHELEAFIWMLPFVFLAYDGGKYDAKTPFIKDWITSNHITYREMKLAFLMRELCQVAVSSVQSGFGHYRELMLSACDVVRMQECSRSKLGLDLARQQIRAAAGNLHPPTPHVAQSATMWANFISALLQSGIDVTTLQKHRPVFDNAKNQQLFKEMKAIHDSLRFSA